MDKPNILMQPLVGAPLVGAPLVFTDEMLDACRREIDFHLCEITLTVAVPITGATFAGYEGERLLHAESVRRLLNAIDDIDDDIQVLGHKSRALRLT